MKLTDKDLISKLLSLPESDLAELLALVAGAPADPGRTGAGAAPLSGWAAATAADATRRPGGRV